MAVPRVIEVGQIAKVCRRPRFLSEESLLRYESQKMVHGSGKKERSIRNLQGVTGNIVRGR